MALSISSVKEVLGRIAGARDVAFGTYVLRPDGPVAKALAAAARRGAHVHVTLQSDPYLDPDDVVRNARSTTALRRAGAHVDSLAHDEVRFHLKAAVVDGVAYLDDRNWTARGREIVVADNDPRDVAFVRAGITEHIAGSNRTLALRKDVALAREAALIRRAGSAPVVVESEYADASALTRALREHARTAPTTLILGSWRHHHRRDDKLVNELRADGVDVRETGQNEKLALVGNSAWIGSANATGGFPQGDAQLEWSVVTHARPVVNEVRKALRRDGAGDALPRG